MSGRREGKHGRGGSGDALAFGLIPYDDEEHSSATASGSGDDTADLEALLGDVNDSEDEDGVAEVVAAAAAAASAARQAALDAAAVRDADRGRSSSRLLSPTASAGSPGTSVSAEDVEPTIVSVSKHAARLAELLESGVALHPGLLHAADELLSEVGRHAQAIESSSAASLSPIGVGRANPGSSSSRASDSYPFTTAGSLAPTPGPSRHLVRPPSSQGALLTPQHSGEEDGRVKSPSPRLDSSPTSAHSAMSPVDGADMVLRQHIPIADYTSLFFRASLQLLADADALNDRGGSATDDSSGVMGSTTGGYGASGLGGGSGRVGVVGSGLGGAAATGLTLPRRGDTMSPEHLTQKEEAALEGLSRGEEVFVSGYLYKESDSAGFSRWKQKFCVVTPGQFRYSAHAADDPKKFRSIKFDALTCICRQVDGPGRLKDSFLFELGSSRAGGVRRLWKARSEADRRRWMDAVKLAMLASMMPGTSSVHKCLLLSQTSQNAMSRQQYLDGFMEYFAEPLSVPLAWVHHRSSLPRAMEKRLAFDFEQVLKDLQRDSFLIHGELFHGVDGAEPLFGCFASHLLRVGHQTGQMLREADALCFAREILTKCTRTTSGGDIFDAVGMLLNNADLVIVCPISEEAAPLSFTVSSVIDEVEEAAAHRTDADIVGDGDDTSLGGGSTPLSVVDSDGIPDGVFRGRRRSTSHADHGAAHRRSNTLPASLERVSSDPVSGASGGSTGSDHKRHKSHGVGSAQRRMLKLRALAGGGGVSSREDAPEPLSREGLFVRFETSMQYRIVDVNPQDNASATWATMSITLVRHYACQGGHAHAVGDGSLVASGCLTDYYKHLRMLRRSGGQRRLRVRVMEDLSSRSLRRDSSSSKGGLTRAGSSPNLLSAEKARALRSESPLSEPRVRRHKRGGSGDLAPAFSSPLVPGGKSTRPRSASEDVGGGGGSAGEAESATPAGGSDDSSEEAGGSAAETPEASLSHLMHAVNVSGGGFQFDDSDGETASPSARGASAPSAGSRRSHGESEVNASMDHDYRLNVDLIV